MPESNKFRNYNFSQLFPPRFGDFSHFQLEFDNAGTLNFRY